MYEQRFGLNRRPFPTSPDDAFYYPATGHESALASLAKAIHEEEGFALLTGEPGIGKTLLGQCLCQRVGQAFGSPGKPAASPAVAYLPGGHYADRTALFQAILFDLQLPYEDGGEQVLRLRLTEHLLKNCANNQHTIVILDEAHHLSVDLLEELRLLGNLEAGGKKAVQFVLLAQETLTAKLGCPELASLKQRLLTRCHLAPLGVDEAVDYLVHHLRQAGGNPEKIIEEAGLEVLARGTKGVPRLLNQAGQQALQLADGADMSIVDSEAALEALASIGQSAESDESESTEETSAGYEIGPRLVEPMKRTA